MTVPYAARLICLCLAVFFLVHTAAAVLVRILTPAILRCAAKFRAQQSAAILLTARLFPMAAAAFAVAGLCAPSYLWLEPAGTREEVGAICLMAAVLGAALLVEAVGRASGAVIRSTRYVRNCLRTASELTFENRAEAVLVLPARRPVLVLAGLWRARLVLSQAIVDSLTEPQLVAALRHEDAHRRAHDNLKRLLVLLAPGMLPRFSGFGKLEAAWARSIEWAADDRAVAGDSQTALALADALVRVARLGASAPPAALATSLLADGRDLVERVERLLQQPSPTSERAFPSKVATACAAAALFPMLHPAVLLAVHSALERLNR